ncbi:MAG: glycine--tRNA ligase subunit beta [Legionellales bacterium]|nr:glycine--tRNA ligase subunit beta [Legionellales bacterium]
MGCDLLFELGTEELPSGSVRPLAQDLASRMVQALAAANIQHGEVRHFSTHRRIAVLMKDVQSMCGLQTISRRGPSVALSLDKAGDPLPSLLGFAKSCGVEVSDLSRSKTEKGEWWIYDAVKPPEKTKDVLAQIIHESLLKLDIAKPMRWGAGELSFVRPVHWVVLLFGDEVVDVKVLGVTSGRKSFGHRFHHPEEITITSPRAYPSLMKEAFVVADFSERRQMIVEQVLHQAELLKANVIMPDALIDEVCSIVEWPQALLAHFDAGFLDVPAEALIAAMQVHQKCFSVCDAEGRLLPHFITVANLASTHPLRVIAGNEKVMRARLSDAAFFYKQDQRQPLSHYFEATSRVIFQARLGSLQDKMQRMQAMISHLVAPLQLKEEDALRAAELSKCDLMTGMVGEFPELQGIMGAYYARHDLESLAVSEAIKEHYLPRFSADDLPSSTLGIALSMADRLDTLVGSFAIDQRPTGVKDPFKLRRHALAMVRLLLSTKAQLSLSTLISQALEAYGEGLKPNVASMAQLKPFILERLQSYYQSQGISSSLVQAVCKRQDDWTYDASQRISAMLTFESQGESAILSALCKRVSHLLKQASLPAGDVEVDAKRLIEPAEIALYERVLSVEREVVPEYVAGDYGRILSHLAVLASPVALFFEQVMVMVDDKALRENRLRLLTRVQQVLHGVADLSLL